MQTKNHQVCELYRYKEIENWSKKNFKKNSPFTISKNSQLGANTTWHDAYFQVENKYLKKFQIELKDATHTYIWRWWCYKFKIKIFISTKHIKQWYWLLDWWPSIPIANTLYIEKYVFKMISSFNRNIIHLKKTYNFEKNGFTTSSNYNYGWFQILDFSYTTKWRTKINIDNVI